MKPLKIGDQNSQQQKQQVAKEINKDAKAETTQQRETGSKN